MYTFPHTWTTDPRSPIYTHGNYELFFMSIPAWLEIGASFLCTASLAYLIGLKAVYPYCYKSQSRLIAYGVVIPFWIYLAAMLTVNHKIIHFCLVVVTPLTATFRTMQAVHGYAPKQHCASSFALFYASPLKLNNESVTIRHLINQVGVFGGHIIFNSILHSCFLIFPNYFPALAKNTNDISDLFNWRKVLSVDQIVTNLKMAILLQVFLTCVSQGMIIITMIVTLRIPEPVMQNPIFGSTSPSEFWGQRWNTIIHDNLKNGVYKPVRRATNNNKFLAVAASFIASGIFHELIVLSVFHNVKEYKCGTNFLFFAWQGVLIVIETITKDWKITKNVAKILPRPVKTIIVVLLGAIPAQWFYDVYIRSGFFTHAGTILFTLRPKGTVT